MPEVQAVAGHITTFATPEHRHGSGSHYKPSLLLGPVPEGLAFGVLSGHATNCHAGRQASLVVPFTVINDLSVIEMKQVTDERGIVRELFRSSDMEGAALPVGLWAHAT